MKKIKDFSKKQKTEFYSHKVQQSPEHLHKHPGPTFQIRPGPGYFSRALLSTISVTLNSKLPNRYNPAQISDFISQTEPTAELYYKIVWIPSLYSWKS